MSRRLNIHRPTQYLLNSTTVFSLILNGNCTALSDFAHEMLNNHSLHETTRCLSGQYIWKPGHIFESPIMNSETKFRPICWKAVDVHKYTRRFQTTLFGRWQQLSLLDSTWQPTVKSSAKAGSKGLCFSVL